MAMPAVPGLRLPKNQHTRFALEKSAYLVRAQVPQGRDLRHRVVPFSKADASLSGQNQVAFYRHFQTRTIFGSGA